METLDQTKIQQDEPSQVEKSKANPVKQYHMRLFIAGDELNSTTARKNLKDICSNHIKDPVNLEVIDVLEDYNAAITENILVAPVLIVDRPKKIKMFGNLQNKDKVLSALGLK